MLYTLRYGLLEIMTSYSHDIIPSRSLWNCSFDQCMRSGSFAKPHVCSGSFIRNRLEFQTRWSLSKHDPAHKIPISVSTHLDHSLYQVTLKF